MSGNADVSEADTVPAVSRLGQIIAQKYRIERLLGRGGMGEVYEARHIVVGRRFAIKFLHAHLARGTDSVARFLREAQAAGALDSEHVAAVLDFDTAADGSPFLVMEYLAGESLAAVLAREGPLPVPRALGFLLQACRGLDAAHRAGIVHRDLKPDNLFVTTRAGGSELIKILDFGIAKLIDAGPGGGVTHSGAILGTPFYMAPEQARGEKSVDFRVDIHALGVVAYELLSAKKPHPGDGYNAILAHILTQPVLPLAKLRPGLPPELALVIERAMAFEPAQRQRSIAELGNELLPFAGREVASVAAHFDLRPPTLASANAATQATVEAPISAHEGTLQSAIGDVGRTSSSADRPRRIPWTLVAAVVGAAVFVVVKLESHAPNADALDAVRTSASSLESAATAKPEPPASAAAPAVSSPDQRALSVPASSVVSAVPSAGRPPAPKRGAVVTGAAAAGKHAHEVSFDEKNPY